MGILSSPGVDVTVVDESFYGSSGPGTVPLIVFATASNKPSPTGVGIATGTVSSQANKLFMMTSQRELIQTFGNPVFQQVEGTPMHGHELNEYGLHAAYQYLGISNRAYVMRADVDLDQLKQSVSPPRGEPINGTYWFDLSETNFGVFQSSGASSLDPFLKQNVIIVFQEADMVEDGADAGKPLTVIGEDGDFAVVVIEATNRVFEKIDGQWYNVGSNAWKFARSYVRAATPIGTVTVGNSFAINGTTVVLTSTSVTQVVADINTAIAGSTELAGKVVAGHDSMGRVKINFTLDTMVLSNVSGTPLADLKLTAGSYKSASLTYAAHNRVPTGSTYGDVWIKTTEINSGAKFAMKFYDANLGQFVTKSAPFYKDDTEASSRLGNPVAGTLYVQYDVEGTTYDSAAGHLIKRWNGSIWEGLSYDVDYTPPTSDPEEGTLWYNANFRVDIMANDGDQWLGYRVMYPDTDPNGVILMSVAPLVQSDETPLVDNDLWIDTSELEDYPRIRRYNATTRRWTLIDNTDQTTPFGIVFNDARADSGPRLEVTDTYSAFSENAIDLTLSNAVDPDCVDPRVYSAGTLLFNTRYATYNVKQWKPEWFKEGGFDENTDFTMDPYTVGNALIEFPAITNPGRWVTVSGNQVDGSPYMGRKAQRQMIVKALSETVAGNEDIRSELVYFNLLAAPGYPELIDEMVILNTDQKEVAFIVADTPSRLKPNATDVQRWATNANNASSNGDLGLTTRNAYLGVYYPWGLTTNVDGSEIMVPPSTVALRTYAYNDQVAYPWFAPAGFTRGLVTNAASVGFLTSENEYQPVILNQGQRDVLYLNNINPIAYIPNRGLVVYGQKTLSPVASALDRVNVARLANYLKYNLDNLAKPFLFEQNDLQTRDSFRITIQRFLMGLVGLRGLEDFAVVCDTTNNTPERRDRNELWADILIKPVKSVEFIYIPVRIRNSGDSLE